jgi:hypothetical protein
MYCVSLLNYNELIFNHISFVHSLSQKEITYVFQFVDTLGDNSMASETPNRINANTNIMIVMTMWWELIVKGKNIISYLVLDIFKFGNYYMWISIFRLAYFIVVIMHNCNFTSCLYYRHNYAQLRFCVLCMLSSQLRTIAILRLVYFFVAITLNCDFSSCAILPWQLHIILMTDTSKTFMRNQLQHILVYLHLDKLLFYVLFNHIYIYILLQDRMTNCYKLSYSTRNPILYCTKWVIIFNFLCSVLYIVVCSFSFGHCVVRPSPICGFWLTLLVASNSSYNTWTQCKTGYTMFVPNHRYCPRAVITTMRNGKLENTEKLNRNLK